MSAVPSDLDALFKLPLGEFIFARNALAARLKKDGRKKEASEAKALPKPSAAAWVANQLYWRHRTLFDRLLKTGEGLRRAQSTGARGDAARDAANARREVLGELGAIAERLLRDAGHVATRDLLRRVTATLEALSSYGEAAGAPVAGRLVDDLEPPGFEAVAGFAGEGEKRGSRPTATLVSHADFAKRRASRANEVAASALRDEARRKELVAAGKASVREAVRALSVARKHAERAAAHVDAVTKRAKEIETQRARIEKQLARLSNDAETAQVLASEATKKADEASRASQAAERALETARHGLQQLTDGEA